MLSFSGMLIFFNVSMDSGTKYYYLEGEYVTDQQRQDLTANICERC
jgi:hypothetical protein